MVTRFDVVAPLAGTVDEDWPQFTRRLSSHRSLGAALSRIRKDNTWLARRTGDPTARFDRVVIKVVDGQRMSLREAGEA